MNRHVAREIALKALFASDLGKNDPYNILELLCNEEKVKASTQNFSYNIIEGVIEKQDYIDGIIQKYSIEWNLERMSAVDRNIMRMALFEVIFLPDIPNAVAVNEAIELAKTYGSDDSARFVNGILGNIIKDMSAES